MKTDIIKNLKSLSFVYDVNGSILTRTIYQIMNSERLDEDSKQLLIDHSSVVLDSSDWDIVKTSKIEFWVYNNKEPIARFFNQDQACEYVLLKLNLI